MRKKILLIPLITTLALYLSACGNNTQNAEVPSSSPPPSVSSLVTEPNATIPEVSATEASRNKEDASEIKVKITAGDQEVFATLEDNATSRALVKKLPMTQPMLDLYDREMCYRFPDALPTDSLRSDGYEVGDLAYWPPRHSFVIMYKQNGEQFERQHIGHIDSGVELFDGVGDIDVTFELLDE